MATHSEQITVKVSPETKADIYKYGQSLTPKLNVAEVCRRALKNELSVGTYQGEEEKQLANMKSALKEVLDPQMERFAKLSSKNSIASATDLLFTSMLLYRLCDPSKREKLEGFMDEARILGIKFVQLGKGSIEDYLRSSMDKLNEMWEE